MSFHDVIEEAFAGAGALSPEIIATLASPRLVQRGLRYARSGRVREVALSGGELTALVDGSGPEPYLVRMSWDGEEIVGHCSCPFDWERFCKHSIAALFAWSGIEGDIEEALDPRFAKVREEALGERTKKGLKHKFKITNQDDDRYYGSFSVESLSGKSYEVEIRSLGEKLNRCTCPDHASNMLGTCKHIEAVLARIRKQAPRKAKELAQERPKVAQVLLSREDAPTIVLRLPPRPPRKVKELCREFFDLSGRLKVDAGFGFQEFLDRAQSLRKIEIFPDAFKFSTEILRERRFAERSAEVAQQILKSGGQIPGVRARLYPFQVEGTAFLASAGRALLADDMGLGKTVQAIAAMVCLQQRREVERTLIVCPASLKAQWAKEIARFCGIEARVIEGGPRVRQELYRARPEVLIANYELVRRDLDYIAVFEPDLLILDEAQRIKNWRTITADSVKQISSPFAFVLTGTPIENRLEELYSLMQVVDRRVLGPLWHFEEHFVERDERGRAVRYRRLGELRRRLRPVLKRRDKREVLTQLPERIDNRFDVALTKKQREYMEEAQQGAARIASIAKRRPLLPKELERLMQLMQMARMACNAAGLVDHKSKGSPKIEEFGRLLREVCVEGGQKAVVFTEWIEFQKMAVAEAKRLKLGHAVLNGSVPTRKREKLIERFMTDPECRVFFSTDSGGVGLNLQAADTVFNLDLPWNPAVLEQRIARVHRQGQRNAVNVLLLIAESSFEARLWHVLSDKRVIFGAALDADTDIEEINSPSSCLAVAREIFDEDHGVPEGFEAAEELPDAATAQAPPIEPTEELPEGAEEPAPPNPEQRCADLLGHRLQQVLQLPSGQRIAVVDQLDEVTQEVTAKLGITALARSVAEGMRVLGAASPLAAAKVLLDRDSAREAQQARRRQSQMSVARRKLGAARSLQSAGMEAEAIEQAFNAMHQAIKSLAGTDEGHEELVPTRLLYEVLVPQNKLSFEQAGLIQRAEALARTYGASTTPVPEGLLSQVIGDVERLIREIES